MTYGQQLQFELLQKGGFTVLIHRKGSHMWTRHILADDRTLCGRTPSALHSKNDIKDEVVAPVCKRCLESMFRTLADRLG